METKDILNRLIYILIFCISSILLEIVTFYFLGFGFLPKYFLFNATFLIIISSLLFFLKSKKTKLILSIIILSLQAILNCINVCYYNVLGDIFSFDLIKLAGETVQAFSLAFIHWFGVLSNIFILTLTILCLIVFTKKQNKSMIKHHKRFSVFAMFLSIFMFFSCTGLGIQLVAENNLTTCSTEDTFYIAKSDDYLYNNFQFKQEAYKKFGTWGFYIKSISNLAFNNNSLSKEDKTEIENYINQGKVKANKNALLSGNNLIVIMLESFDEFAIDPYCTPNLFDIQQNGQNFTNFFARNKTNMSENISMLGNVPKDTDFTILSKNKNFSPKNSLANMFKDLGYTTNYFHSYDGSFYNRYSINKKLGFENMYALKESGLSTSTTFGNANLETDFLNIFMDKFAPTDKKFFSFYTTFGTHGTYDDYNFRYQEYYDYYEQNLVYIKHYLEKVQNFHFPTDKTFYNRLKNYKCAAMDTDKMIGNLLNYLETNNLLDTTTIVLYSDHNSYATGLNFKIRYNTIDIDPNNSDQYNIPFMIYDKKLSGGQNDMFCSTYDIYPTICDLFGLEYNKNLTQGYNVFSNEIENSIFVSNLTGMFTDKLYSYNIMNVIDFSGENLSEENIYKFQLNAVKFFEKQKKIDQIYINQLNNKLY